MRQFWARFVTGGASGFLAALLLALILALQYLAGLLTLEMAKVSKERELSEHLLDLGRVAPATLTRPALSLADLAFDAQWQENQQHEVTSATTAAEFYRAGLEADLTSPFDRFAVKARLTKLVLIAEDGMVLYDTQSPAEMLRRYDFHAIDRGEIALALRGQASAAPFYTSPHGRPIKRVYLPLREGDPSTDDGRVRAVLCLWAGDNYLDGIAVLGRNLFHVNIVLTVLMGLVGILISSLVRRARRYARQAAEADRLAGLGSLAAGFAHELRNPLGIIRAYTEDLERGLRSGASPEESAEACRDVIEEVDRMNGLVGQFLNYSRRQTEISGATAPLLETTRSVLNMLRPSAEKTGVTLSLDYGSVSENVARRWTAGLDPGELKQVLINLTLNAIQASHSGDTVTLSLLPASRHLELRVLDQGPGVPEKNRGRIFEPFFSTRPAGAGLGLAISRQIADRAGGTLRLAPARPGHGACFVLTLPRTRDEDPQSECRSLESEFRIQR